MGCLIPLHPGCAFAAGHAAAQGVFEAREVGGVLRREGVQGYAVVGRGEGLRSHATMVGRGVASAQRARVTLRTVAPLTLTLTLTLTLSFDIHLNDRAYWRNVPAPVRR